MRAHTCARWLTPALVVLSIALPACKTAAPKEDPAPATPASRNPHYQRFDCAETPATCLEVGAQALAGASVLMTREQGFTLLADMCNSDRAIACAALATHMSAELMLHDAEQPFVSATGLERGEVEERIVAFNDRTLQLLEGSCARKLPEHCSWLLDAHLRQHYNTEDAGPVAENKELVPLFETGEELCLAGKEDRFRLCSVVSTWFSLTSENYPDQTRRARVEAHLQSLEHPPCPKPGKRYSPAGCSGKPERERAALAACQAGDELGCADLVNARQEEIAYQETSIAQLERIVAISTDLDTLPETYAQLTEEQRERGRAVLEQMYKEREKRDALLPAWREAHRVGCVEAKVQEICDSWKKACAEAMSSAECQDIP